MNIKSVASYIKEPYSIIIDGITYEIVVKEAEEEELIMVADLYEKVAISKNNIGQKLSFSDENNFKNMGGIFNIFRYDDLLRFFQDDKYKIFVIRNAQEIMAAMLLIKELPIKRDDNLVLNFKDEESDLVKNLEPEKGFYTIDFIQNKKYSHKKLIYPLFYESFFYMYSIGYVFSLYEIYAIVGYKFQGEYIKTYLPNIKSMKLNESYGAYAFYKKDGIIKNVNDYIVEINSNYYIVNIDNVINKMKELMEAYNIFKIR